MMDKVRYGIIGCGNIAHGFHLREMTAIPEAELIATADVQEARTKSTAERFGAKAWYTDYKKLLERDDVEAVIVSTYHPTHAAIGSDVLAAGKHVLVQKPMTTNMADADKLVSAAVEGRKRGLKSYCLPFNWTPSYEMAIKLIKDGAIGKICQARRRVAHGGPGRQSWFYDPKIAVGGALFDMGVYAVSGITGLLGNAISAIGLIKSLEEGVKIDDNATIQLEFENGAIGSAETSWTQQASREGTVIYGTEGTIYLDSWDTPISVYLTKPARGWFTPQLPSAPPNAAHRHFVDCILKDQPPKGTPEHGRHVVEIMLAGYESEKSGQRVKIKTRF